MKASLIVFGLIWSALVIDVNGQNPAGRSNAESFDPSRIDASVVDQFYLAWRCSGFGTSDSEALVLVFRKPDGSYLADYQGCSNEFARYRFAWKPGIIAIVHTHRDVDDAKPSSQDQSVANRFRVPIVTLTRRGMFV
ncbi:MAG TPA: hypothetical protein VKF81_12820, partial [Blastocatellia bacterium]|nr:hypothetical protein [Blastocatellia bacterium]